MRTFIIRFLRVGLRTAHPCLPLFILLGLIFPTHASATIVPKFAYVANYNSNNVSVYMIDPTTGALTAGTAVAAGLLPDSVTVDPSGKFAYVANDDSSDVSVYTINQTTGALTAGTAVAAGTNPASVAVDPSGRFAYVANASSNNVSVYTIDQTTGALTAGTAVAAGIGPRSVTVDPSGRFAYVANRWSHDVSVYAIDQTTGALTAGTVVVMATYQVHPTYAPTQDYLLTVESNPRSVIVHPSGRFAYVASEGMYYQSNRYSGPDSVSVYTIDQTTGALTAGTAVAAGTNPASVTVDPSGKFAYIANKSPSNVSVYMIDQTTGALTAGTAVAACTNPASVAVDPSGRFAYVANVGSYPDYLSNVSVYRINPITGALTAGTAVAAGSYPTSVATTAGATIAPPVTAGAYKLSGGVLPTDALSVDDDMTVYVNGTAIFVNTTWGANSISPISFTANSGDVLRVTAVDSFGYCHGMSPLYLHLTSDGNVTALDSVGVGGGCDGAPATQVPFYDRAFTIGTTIVSRTSQTIGAITFSPTALAVGGSTTVSATATSGLAATYTSTTTGVCTVSGSTVTGVAAGTCAIAADQAGNASYNAAPQVTQNITIGNVSRSDCIFNWAEQSFAQYFSPAGATSATYPPYYYRYYSGTGNYLATSSADNNLYALGPDTGWSLLNAGPVTDFLGVSGCP